MDKETAIEPYSIRKFVDGETLEITTAGNIAIPVSLELLGNLVWVMENDRIPNVTELAMFATTIIEQRCNPYLKECWLVMMRGKYEPIIAAQKRVAKAQSMPNYDGFEWGWIGKDGVRCPCGPESTVKEADIAGVWCRVHFKDRKVPFYHEIWRSEYKHEKNARPLTMLMKTARDQVHKFAYANEMGNLCTENEPQDAFEALPVPECDTPPRDERRKKLESVTLEGDRSKVTGTATAGVRGDRSKEIESTPVFTPPPREPAEPSKEGTTDDETEVSGSAGEEEIDISKLYTELKASYDEKGGDNFVAWAADALCVSDDEVATPADFTVDMIESLSRALAERGI